MLKLTGIIFDNIHWMYTEDVKRKCESTFNGYLLLDEMSIQEDLQIVKRGSKWSIIGAIDLGVVCNSLEELTEKKRSYKLASHCFQYMFVGFNGFRWPVAYYASDNVNGHCIWVTFHEVVGHLKTFDFNVHGAIIDGSSNNRQFMHIMVDPSTARMTKFTATNIYNLKAWYAMVQDCKHVFKKIRNSLLSSTPTGKREITLNGQKIYWTYFQEAYAFNSESEWKYFHRLKREHIYISAQGKMRNHFATDTLGSNMLELFQKLQMSKGQSGYLYDSTIELLKHTS